MLNNLNTYQSRVRCWIIECFGLAIANHSKERNHRFGEESLEALQAFGTTKEEVLELVEYVYSRPVGDPKQEVGGVMVTLAAKCAEHNIDMMECAETELARILSPEVMERIRQKQLTKPAHSTLPGLAQPKP